MGTQGSTLSALPNGQCVFSVPNRATLVAASTSLQEFSLLPVLVSYQITLPQSLQIFILHGLAAQPHLLLCSYLLMDHFSSQLCPWHSDFLQFICIPHWLAKWKAMTVRQGVTGAEGATEAFMLQAISKVLYLPAVSGNAARG